MEENQVVNVSENQIEIPQFISWQERTALNETTLCAAVETIIFMSERPIPLMKIKNGIDSDIPMEILFDAVKTLQMEYEQAQHGIRLVEINDGYQFRTKATYSKFIQDTLKINPVQLTKSTLDVLAVIAYRQPILKTEIEKIRGVDSNHLIRTLLDKRLIKIDGRGDELGRSIQYVTTPEFLEVFNLKNLSDLPPEHELSSLASKNEIGTIDHIRDFFKKDWKDKFFSDDLSEIDQLGSMIESIKTDTDFTRMLKHEDKRKVETLNPEVLNLEIPIEPVAKKTAFELLEEYLERARIAGINEEAAQSELVTSVADFKMVKLSDLDLGMLNAPIVDMDDDILEEDQTIDLFQEKKELEMALDKAFSDLTSSRGDEDSNLSKEEFIQADQNLAEMENRLEQKESDLALKAKDFEIDLDFLKSVQKDLMDKIQKDASGHEDDE